MADMNDYNIADMNASKPLLGAAANSMIWLHIESVAGPGNVLDIVDKKLVVEKRTAGQFQGKTNIFYFETGKTTQLWRINDERKLENKEVGLDWTFGNKRLIRVQQYIQEEETGKVLDISGSDFRTGTEVILWTKNRSPNQAWYLKQDISPSNGKYFK